MRSVRRRFFPGSADYWDRRYRRGGDSGPGSYGPHAVFKAEFLNSFVSQQDVASVVEFGCGDGNQLGLAVYPDYLGFDVSPRAIDRCQAAFGNDPAKRFELYDPRTYRVELKAELALSLDVILHLVEPEVLDLHLAHLFGAASRYVIVYGSDVDRDLRASAAHVRYRQFTPLIEQRFPQWALADVVKGIEPVLEREPRTDFFVYRAR